MATLFGTNIFNPRDYERESFRRYLINERKNGRSFYEVARMASSRGFEIRENGSVEFDLVEKDVYSNGYSLTVSPENIASIMTNAHNSVQIAGNVYPQSYSEIKPKRNIKDLIAYYYKR